MTSGSPMPSGSIATQRTKSHVAVLMQGVTTNELELPTSRLASRSSDSVCCSTPAHKPGGLLRTSTLQRYTSMELQMHNWLEKTGGLLSFVFFVVMIGLMLYVAELRIFNGRHFAHMITTSHHPSHASVQILETTTSTDASVGAEGGA